jgi:hypothetical protein
MTAIPAVRKNQPLPLNPFHKDLDASFHAAYDRCLRHEEATREAKTKSKEEQYAKEVVYGRCLGYLLTETPHTNGKRMVSEGIIKCNGQREKMNELAETYINHLIRLCQWFSFTPLRLINVSHSPTEQGGNAFSHRTSEPSVVRRDRDSLWPDSASA